MIRTICRATGITGITAGLVMAMTLSAGAAPTTPAHTAVTPSAAAAVQAAVAQGISRQVKVGDLITKAQAQRAWVASSHGDKRIAVVQESSPPASAEAGSPYFLGNFRQSAVASAAVRYRGSVTKAGIPYGEIVQQRTFAYADAAAASRALTRDLTYLRGLRLDPQTIEVQGFLARRVAGVGDDAYWRSVAGPDGLESSLVFRQGNVVTLLSTEEYEVHTVEQTSISTVKLAKEIAPRQRTTHSGSAPTPAVLALGKSPIRTFRR